MWAWRSFLRRSSPLASRLGPVRRRHDATKPVDPGRNDLPLGHRPAPAPAPKGHLYMVLDDNKIDYGIYKLDVDADLHASCSSDDSPQRAPRPAIRLEVPKITCPGEPAQFAAAGGCIIATGKSARGWQRDDGDVGITMVYDTRTPALYAPCGLPEGLFYGHVAAVPVGDMLYALETHSAETWGGASFHCFTTRAEPQDDDDDGETSKKKQLARGRWHHYDESGASRCAWSDTGRKVVDNLPFSPDDIAAHAVLGLTIYVSVSGFSGEGAETFAYDTTTRGDWTKCGDWAMPFLGAAAGYDADLGAWVGLHATGRCQGTGHLAACRVPDESGCLPEWKVGGEKMLLEDPDWKHAEDGGAKLVYMVGRGEYCLFERLRRRKGADEKKECSDGGLFELLRRCEGTDGKKKCLAVGDECLLLLTTFRVGYDEAGELTATDRRTTRYKVPSYREDFEAQAFWI